jgi:hypothetical protein
MFAGANSSVIIGFRDLVLITGFLSSSSLTAANSSDIIGFRGLPALGGFDVFDCMDTVSGATGEASEGAPFKLLMLVSLRPTAAAYWETRALSLVDPLAKGSGPLWSKGVRERLLPLISVLGAKEAGVGDGLGAGFCSTSGAMQGSESINSSGGSSTLDSTIGLTKTASGSSRGLIGLSSLIWSTFSCNFETSCSK